jgi:predicted house-cleaning noncanonical NTP pyrophosphatase (MazG superfamily)
MAELTDPELYRREAAATTESLGDHKKLRERLNEAQARYNEADRAHVLHNTEYERLKDLWEKMREEMENFIPPDNETDGEMSDEMESDRDLPS